MYIMQVSIALNIVVRRFRLCFK